MSNSDLQKLQDDSTARIRAVMQARDGARPSTPIDTMLVRAAEAAIPVKLMDGSRIGTVPVAVLKNDVFIARRIRDGSLVVVDSSTIDPPKPEAPKPPPLDLGHAEAPTKKPSKSSS